LTTHSTSSIIVDPTDSTLALTVIVTFSYWGNFAPGDAREEFNSYNEDIITIKDVFRGDTGAEVDYNGLEFETRETIKESCLEYIKQQKQNEP
jgi:hypothetical protein